MSVLRDNGAMTRPAHPEPTTATVKQLFAHAFRCAEPNCTRPLYRQDDATGELILNSRIAHIHARRSGGPRWIQMTTDANRAPDNLLLLCIEHSYEIDERAGSYPADLLREWKAAQIAEYEQLARNWPLSDVDAGRVLEASAQARTQQHADAVVALVRAVRRLTLETRRARSGPAAHAAAWRALIEQTHRSMPMWDDEGERIYVEPSRNETNQCKAALLKALGTARTSLDPTADAVKVELAAVQASRPSTRPWTDWVSTAVDDALTASGTWPGLPALEDNTGLEDTLRELERACDALTAAWRGESSSPPPTRTEATPSLPEPDPLQAHRALLDLARPYSRVRHKPYEPELRAQLADAAGSAAGIPPVLSALGVGLSTTCSLAAAVAANATDEQLADLAMHDAARGPLSAAVQLLAETARTAGNRGRDIARTQAEAALVDLWESIDFADSECFNSVDANGASVLHHGARISSPDLARQRLEAALASSPELLLPMVSYCAEWVEKVNSDDWRPVGMARRYRELPAWFPTAAVVAAAHQIDLSDIKVDSLAKPTLTTPNHCSRRYCG
jgi:hypothetical protein